MVEPRRAKLATGSELAMVLKSLAENVGSKRTMLNTDRDLPIRAWQVTLKELPR